MDDSSPWCVDNDNSLVTLETLCHYVCDHCLLPFPSVLCSQNAPHVFYFLTNEPASLHHFVSID